MKKLILLTLFLLSPVISVLRAQDADDYTLREVASGFSRPVLVTHAGDDRLFVVEQDGRIEIIDNGTVRGTAFLDVTSLITRGGNEQGLLGLAFHPDYPQNGWFFINYTNRSGDTVVARYTVSSNANIANAASAVTVLTVDQPFSNHNGGNLVFGPDGYLYIGLGDGGSGGDPQNRAQNRQMLLGKMLRINVDQLPYTIPSSNPFANSTSTLPEIWALGLRNPWRYTFDRATGDLYIADVGQNAWEEVNFQAASSTGGENYGWNVYEGTHPFSGGSLSGATMPVAEYPRSFGCSVTGGYVYRGTLAPGLEGRYLYGDYCTGIIWTMQRDSGGRWVSTQFMDTVYNISSFGEDVRGDIYITDLGGSVLRLEAVTPPPATPTFTPTASQTPLPPTGTPSQTPLPTLTPTLTSTASQTPLPTGTATFTPTGTPPPTLTATPTETATLPPTSTLEPTLSETPVPTNPPEATFTAVPTGPTLFVDVIPQSASVGEAVSVTLNLANVTGVYGLQAMCVVDPAVLAGAGRADGDGFNASSSFFVDNGSQPDGRWLVAASRLQPSEAINGGAAAFSLLYTVQSAGSSAITCDVLAVDEDGRPLSLTVVNGSFNSAAQPTATTEATIEPTLTETPVVEPTITETPEVVTTPDPTGQSTISGSVAYQNRPDKAGITVQLLGLDGAVIAEAVTASDGAYSFADVALGAYMLQASAPLHVTLQRPILVEADGQVIAVAETVLPAGDTDNNGVIDVTDATFIGANFDVTAPPAPANADLNGDALVNITDLVLVGSNFGLTGPVVVE